MYTFNRENPYKIRLLQREKISGENSEKEVYKLIFNAEQLDYLPGDSLAVFPQNDPYEVQKILQILHLKGDEYIEFKEASFNISQVLAEKYCITHLSKRFLSTFSERLNAEEREKFEKNFTGEHDDQYSLLELLECFPAVQFSPDELCKLLKKSAPRFYSIASARTLQTENIHLLVKTVSYTNFLGNLRHGVVSNFLNHRLKIGECADAYISPSSFKLPDDPQVDIIMVGPGTGLAPFMGFLYELEARKKLGTDISKTWLFFGDQHESSDFIERDELIRLSNEDVLSRLELAFSRDQDMKIYVQDRMWEARDELWTWLTRGAHFYVCGNASRMATDVEQMLKNIANSCGGLPLEEANKWVTDLRQSGRYHKDVY